MLPFLDYFKTIKGALILIGCLLALMFLGYRSCNKKVSEVQNENIEINKVKPPTDDAYDANCLRLTNKPCPARGK